jgi:VWFA-related protein
VACTCLLASAVLSARSQAPTFRAGVDLIAVDVQVVDDKGTPIVGLGPDRFDVTIGGKKRRVVSADLLRFDDTTLATPAAARSTAASTPVPALPFTDSNPRDGRVFVLAVDAMSFQALETAPVREAAHTFVDRLQPNDLVGFLSFPFGQSLDATDDHVAATRALDRLIGQGDPASISEFKLTPSEIVDLTSLPLEVQASPPPLVQLQRQFPVQGRTIGEICAEHGGSALCVRSVLREASTTAQMEEGMILRRLGALRDGLRELERSPRRKIVVLVSGGMLASDRPGGRPDIEDMGRIIGESAARANSTVYVLHVDRQRMNRMTAASNRRARSTDDAMRDSAIVARPLTQIAAASGGALFTAIQGGGEFAFAQIARETSAYYLLGVEPEASDRDGKPRALRVKADTGRRGATVRARSWVIVPK